jgi:hypothetical protein
LPSSAPIMRQSILLSDMRHVPASQAKLVLRFAVLLKCRHNKRAHLVEPERGDCFPHRARRSVERAIVESEEYGGCSLQFRKEIATPFLSKYIS